MFPVALLCVLWELMFVHCRVKFLHNVRNYSLRKYFIMVMNVGIAVSDGLKQRNVEVNSSRVLLIMYKTFIYETGA